MNKAKKTTPLAEAREALKKAQADYGRLVGKSLAQMTDKERTEHQKACRKALADKRYAAGVVEALAAGREPPDRKEVKEATI